MPPVSRELATRPLVKRAYQKNISLTSQPKHMLYRVLRVSDDKVVTSSTRCDTVCQIKLL